MGAPTAPVPIGMSLSAFQHGFSTHWMDVDRDPPEWFVDVIGTAIDVGYRRIDCNPDWDTESMVRTAIARSSVPRDELFVTIVIPQARLGWVGARESITASLGRLGLDRIDLALVSAPSSGWDIDGTAASIETLVDEGRVAHVGAHYMSLPDLDSFAARLGSPMFAHLTELHPLWQAHHYRRHASENGYWVIADSPFMQGMVREVREISHAAVQNDATAWQVVLAWLHQLPGVATSTWTHDRVQMVDNLAAARRLSLDRTDTESINRIDRRWSGSPHLHPVT